MLNLPSSASPTFIAVIEQLPPDRARSSGRDRKEQWLAWLDEYDEPGYYKRKGTGYDAKFAYDHVQNHHMLLWLVGAAKLETATLSHAAVAAEQGKSKAQKAAAVRKLVPWNRALELLWPNGV